jgi:hypothetical protein
VLYIWQQATKLSLSVEERLKRTHILLKRLLIEKLVVPHLVKKYSDLYGNLIHYTTTVYHY